MAISMLKIRRPLGRLIFNMRIAIPGKTVFLIETAPWSQICRTNGTSGQWVIGPMGRRTNEPYSIVAVVYMINGLSDYLVVGQWCLEIKGRAGVGLRGRRTKLVIGPV